MNRWQLNEPFVQWDADSRKKVQKKFPGHGRGMKVRESSVGRRRRRTSKRSAAEMISAVISQEITGPEIERPVFARAVIVPCPRPGPRAVPVVDRRRIVVPGRMVTRREGASEDDTDAETDCGGSGMVVMVMVMAAMTMRRVRGTGQGQPDDGCAKRHRDKRFDRHDPSLPG